MAPHPETQSPIRLLVPQERDPGLVAANRRFMQARDQSRRLINKTAQDERDAQAGITPEMRAMKEARVREDMIAEIMEATGGTREEAAGEVDAQQERALLDPEFAKVLKKEEERLGKRGLERMGGREAFRQRKAQEKQAMDALGRGDSATISQILGVRAEYDTAPDVFQKAWTVGGIRMSPGKVKQRVLAKVRRAVTQEMRERFAPTMEERGRAGLRREAGEAMLPGVPVAPTKPKPVKLDPMAGAPGIYVDEAKLAEIQQAGGDPQDAIIDLSPIMADPERVERLRKIARAAGGKPAEIFTQTYVAGVGYLRIAEDGTTTVIQKAPARWRLSGPEEVDGKTKYMWIPEPGQVGPDGKPLKPKVAWEEKLPVVGPEKDEIKGWEFDPATKKYVAVLVGIADGKPTGVVTRIGSPGFRPAGWGAPPSKDRAAYAVSYRKITQKDSAGKDVEGDAPVVEWLDKKTGQVRFSRGDILALRPEQAIQIGAEAETEAGAPAFDFISDDRLEGNTSVYLNEYAAELEPLAEQGDERAQAQLERIREITVERATRRAGKGK